MLALDVFIHRLRAGIGSMIASLGGVDALVFTDRIAEDEPVIRKAGCEAFEFLGLELDQKRNAASPADADIASARSKVRALIIRARENWQIAHECAELC
jgi:acetate kinase